MAKQSKSNQNGSSANLGFEAPGARTSSSANLRFEAKLWLAADKLRNNMDAAGYYLLKYIRPVPVETARDQQAIGLGHVTIADMKRLQVCRAPDAVLASFDYQVSGVFDKAFANALQTETVVTLHDTLLPKLITAPFLRQESCISI